MRGCDHNTGQNELGATVEGSGHPLFYLPTAHSRPASVLIFLGGHLSLLSVHSGTDSTSLPRGGCHPAWPVRATVVPWPKWLVQGWAHDSTRTRGFCAVIEKRNSLSSSWVAEGASPELWDTILHCKGEPAENEAMWKTTELRGKRLGRDEVM